jgi:dTMP kinase
VREARPTGRRGRFITFEGPEGSGKTSQARRLHARAVAAGIPTLLAREPGGTDLGERVRRLVLVETDLRIDARADALLFSAARAEHVSEVIAPALDAGRLVLCARFSDSTIAYQGYGRGLPIDGLRALQAFATDGLAPDLTILLDLPAEVGLGRKPHDEHLRFEAAFDLEFHRRVRDGYLELAAAEPGRFAIVDAAPSPDAVHASVLAALQRFPELAALDGLPTDDEPNTASART